MQEQKVKIVFFGTPNFAVHTLRAICDAGHHVAAVVTAPDRPAGRGLKMAEPAVKTFAVERGLPVLQPQSLRDASLLEQLRELKPDIFVVVAFRMMPQCLWSLPRLGSFNLHASLLPQYRGAAPINWAVINGETTTGVTTFMLNERIDEGELLLQESTPITPADNAGTLHDRLAEIGSRLVLRTIDGLADGSLHPTPQQVPPLLHPAPKIFKPDCAIDWRKGGDAIVNHVRGLAPYPAATMTLCDTEGRENTFKVYEATFKPDPNAVPFCVNSDQKTYLKIGINSGFINILSLQPSGKRQMSVEEFLRGRIIKDWKLIY